jgi:hypothetical protein
VIIWPARAATLSGVIYVPLPASDLGGGPVWVELSLDGTPIAPAAGPTATLERRATQATTPRASARDRDRVDPSPARS